MCEIGYHRHDTYSVFCELLASLAPTNSSSVLLAIDFNDTTQPAQFDVCTVDRKFAVAIAAPVGELLRPNTLNEKDFLSLQSESAIVAFLCPLSLTLDVLFNMETIVVIPSC